MGLHAKSGAGMCSTGPVPSREQSASPNTLVPLPLGLFPEPKPGASLKAARKKIWSIGEVSRLDGPLEQPGEEYARQIYPGVLEQLWVETVVDARRVGAIMTNRSYRGDVWFSCWFNPLRSSYGLYHYGWSWVETIGWKWPERPRELWRCRRL